MIKKIAMIALCGLFVLTLEIVPMTVTARAYESLAYLYGGSTPVYMNRLALTGGNITMVAPDYLETGPDGGIKYSKTVDPVLIAGMREKGITCLPFLSNHWKREDAQKMLQKRAAAARDLAAAVREHDLDGLDIDIQNITPADKADFTDFIRLLRGAMPNGTRLTVCVPANPYNTDKGWQGAYDYAALSEYCDHIFIMTYDESFDGGPPGPVASYWFVEESIKNGLKYVPREKLMIGIPLYGRFWTDSVKGAAFTTADIMWLIENADSTVWYDESKDCARAKVTIPEGASVTTWGGRKISAGVYDIWYDNDRSYEKKLSLVRQYGLCGVGIWALGQEPSDIWSKYAVWLHGHAFDDVRDHWAQSYILALKDTGIINGRGDRLFDPEGRLTRAEAAAMLVRLAGVDTSRGGSPFSDTAEHWAADYIAAARDVELVSGVSETHFMPDRYVTREEFAAMADRYTSIDDTFDMTEFAFSDVSAERNLWSIRSIVKMNIYGVISGYPDGTFRPGAHITRAEAAKIISLLSDLPTRFLSGGVLPLQRSWMSPR